MELGQEGAQVGRGLRAGDVGDGLDGVGGNGGVGYVGDDVEPELEPGLLAEPAFPVPDAALGTRGGGDDVVALARPTIPIVSVQIPREKRRVSVPELGSGGQGREGSDDEGEGDGDEGGAALADGAGAGAQAAGGEVGGGDHVEDALLRPRLRLRLVVVRAEEEDAVQQLHGKPTRPHFPAQAFSFSTLFFYWIFWYSFFYWLLDKG